MRKLSTHLVELDLDGENYDDEQMTNSAFQNIGCLNRLQVISMNCPSLPEAHGLSLLPHSFEAPSNS